jgi:thiamine-phosphate pyrophosphorylase
MTRDGGWRRARLARSRLYLCTDRRSAQDDPERFLDAVLGAGVDIVQLRDKDATEDDLRAAATIFRALAHRHDALFILNDLPGLARAVDADGVHVGQEDPTPAQARTVVGADRLVGRSTHDPDEASRALDEDCDTFTVGPVHATPTKEGRPGVGLELVRYAAGLLTDKPWFVSGGMTTETAPDVLAAGGRRLVVVRAITDAADPAAAVRELAALQG